MTRRLRNLTNMGLAGVLAGVSLLCSTALAGDAGEATALTIYSSAAPGAIPPELYRPVLGGGGYNAQYASRIPGYAIVKQERTIELVQGRGKIRFADVAAQIDPTTVSFTSLTDPANTHVLEQNFEFDLVSTDKLMKRYLDRKITVDQIQGDKVETLTGTLLSTAGGLVLKGADGGVQVLTEFANVRFPKLPGGLITRPTLVWDVQSNRPGPHRTRVTYETKGVTWWADYNIVFTAGDDANSGLLDVGAWVSIINQSGASYKNAKLKLIAGDVHRAPQPRPRAPGKRMYTAEAAAVPTKGGFE